VAYFHVHPDVRLERLDANHWQGYLPGGQVFDLSFEGGNAEQQSGTWHPAFGASIANHCLVLALHTNEIRTRISWSEI
jgi:hypothetical protein